jgi:major membrane immunogen (membrane-anchored lipoprotein)
MKYRTTITLIFCCILATACSTTIPLQTILNSQTLLEAKNKNIKADFTLNSKVPKGKITEYFYKKNGKKSNTKDFDYKSTTAFKKMWSSYFDNKFNDFSDDKMKINVTLNDLYLKQQMTTSTGHAILTGMFGAADSKSNVEAVADITLIMEYKGNSYKKEFNPSTSDYQETHSTNYATFSKKNPTEQRAVLLQNVLNKSIIQYDNFVNQVLVADK